MASNGTADRLDAARRPIVRYRLPDEVVAAPAPPGRPLYVLGLGRTHCATAALLRDGEIVACASEERFTREKNAEVFPTHAIEYVLRHAGIGVDDLALAVYPYAATDVLTRYRSLTAPTSWSLPTAVANRVAYRAPRTERVLQWGYYRLYHDLIPRFSSPAVPSMFAEPVREVGMDPARITAADHHTCHGYAAHYGFGPGDGAPTLVITHDAEGDGLSTMVAVARDGEYRTISTSPSRHSLATLYAAVTEYLGMRRNEHEYKIMGLAPYASELEVERALPVFEELIWVNPDTLQFETSLGSGTFPLYLRDRLYGLRFDGIAGALQRHVERLIREWVAAAVRRTGIHRVAVGGGLFMNVKGNKALLDLPEVEELIPCPSAADESTAIGAAYWGYEQICRAWRRPFEPKPVQHLYLGPAFDDAEIEAAIAAAGDGLRVERPESIAAAVADLLARGEVVARFDGRMEWGARALGNRSILANPSRADVVPVLNAQIKNRDFWMPFAATVLAERADDYIANPRGQRAPFMAVALDTQPLAHDQLRAAIHPADHTCRPQVLEECVNPGYHAVIKAFEERTGIGGVLNTSFNLHGEPIVCTPADAVSTLVRSGLQHLALGPYLVSKSPDPSAAQDESAASQPARGAAS